MPLIPFERRSPRVDAGAWVAPTAVPRIGAGSLGRPAVVVPEARAGSLSTEADVARFHRAVALVDAPRPPSASSAPPSTPGTTDVSALEDWVTAVRW